MITGGPGTGKTTTITALIRFFEWRGWRWSWRRPRGERQSGCRRPPGGRPGPSTAFWSFPDAGESSAEAHFARNRGEPSGGRRDHIDEMSMVDIQLMQSLLEAAAPGTRLILVGDRGPASQRGAGKRAEGYYPVGPLPCGASHQDLPPGRGQRHYPHAHRINRGEPVDVTARSRDFLFIRRPDANAIINAAISLICRSFRIIWGFP